MKNIKNWNKYFESLAVLSESDKDLIGQSSIEACYSIWGYINKPIVKKHGIEIEGEILRLSRNNRLLLNKLNSWSPGTTVEEIQQWIKDNAYELYHPQGKYFNEVIGVLKSSSKRGRGLEDIAKDCLVEYSLQKGLEIFPITPSREKDQAGYDFFWKEPEGIRSAQVKTLDKVTVGPKRYTVYCKGHLKKLETNYLVAINDNECYIFTTWGQYVDPAFYSFPIRNLVFHKTFLETTFSES